MKNVVSKSTISKLSPARSKNNFINYGIEFMIKDLYACNVNKNEKSKKDLRKRQLPWCTWGDPYEYRARQIVGIQILLFTKPILITELGIEELEPA